MTSKQAYWKNPELYREKARNYRLAHLEESKERNRQWYLRNKAEFLRKHTNYRPKYQTAIRQNWSAGINAGLTRFRFEIATKAEDLAQQILEREGFANIVWLNNHHAAFDFLATRNGVCYSIDVTIAPYKNYGLNSNGNRRALEWLIQHLGLTHIILFVSPDMNRYIIKQKKPHVRCVALTKFDIENAKDCGKDITWDKSGNFFANADGSKHDCRTQKLDQKTPPTMEGLIREIVRDELKRMKG